MMELHFSPHLRGCVKLPASKSISNRVLVMAALAKEPPRLDNLSDSDDTRAALHALHERPETVDVGAAGTAMRFSTAFFAATEGEHLLTGSKRMLQRPIHPLVDALRSLGADIAYEGTEGFPPLRIRGQRLAGGKAELAADVSSQYISALLMVAPAMAQGLQLTLRGEVVSRPYIEMTLSLMRSFGAKADWCGENTLTVAPQPYERRTPFTVEADWSAASYWYELLALTPDADARLTLPHLAADSLQGDARVYRFFEPLGVRTDFTEAGVVLTKAAANPTPVALDLTQQPDLAQTLVVTCALLDRPFHFTGLQSLRIKETDRITALQTELAKLGYVVEDRRDSELLWEGRRCTPNAAPVVDTYDDHRMAMAFAPAAYRFDGLRIRDEHVVSKSYPAFWRELNAFLLP